MYFVRFIPMPSSVEGVTLPNDDGTYDVYINVNLPVERCREALAHELQHIRFDHLYENKPVWLLEQEAG